MCWSVPDPGRGQSHHARRFAGYAAGDCLSFLPMPARSIWVNWNAATTQDASPRRKATRSAPRNLWGSVAERFIGLLKSTASKLARTSEAPTRFGASLGKKLSNIAEFAATAGKRHYHPTLLRFLFKSMSCDLKGTTHRGPLWLEIPSDATSMLKNQWLIDRLITAETDCHPPPRHRPPRADSRS